MVVLIYVKGPLKACFRYPDATREQVIAAAKRACCHEFINALPHGYETVLEEGGSNLSGGKRQRISIARVIMKDAPIVMLDVATSSVDPENEHDLMKAIAELTKGKTLITVAHRLNTPPLLYARNSVDEVIAHLLTL